MTTCIRLLLDISIDNDHAILWIKTEDGHWDRRCKSITCLYTNVRALYTKIHSLYTNPRSEVHIVYKFVDKSLKSSI
jgi:hypothetical protein